MSFGQFCERVLTILSANYRWEGALAGNKRESVLDKLFENYSNEAYQEPPDWKGRIQSTALAINTDCR